MPLIYVIRHGQASFGRSNYDELSEKGIIQSSVLGNFFKKTQTKFDKVYSGSLERQVKTSAFALEAMGEKCRKNEINEGFNEYNHMDLINAALDYSFEQKGVFVDLEVLAGDRKLFQNFFSKAVENWIKGEFSGSGIQTYENYCEQVLNAFEKISQTNEKNSKIAVFTSGGPISVILENTLGINSFKAVEIGWGIKNCSITCISSKGEFNRDTNKFLLRQFNCTAHFELENEDNLITYR